MISIHALLAESDRRAKTISTKISNFYPRSPCGERLVIFLKRDTPLTISIHALLAESDCTTTITICTALRFLSTLSLRRATGLMGGLSCDRRNFYPRSPCGERPGKIRIFDDILNFYPRSPCGERPLRKYPVILGRGISIHALLAESDNRFIAGCQLPTAFLSTLSLRRATIISPHSTPDNGNFYPRSPCGERPHTAKNTSMAGHFYPRSPCGERPWQRGSRITYVEFLSTLSLRRATL